MEQRLGYPPRQPCWLHGPAQWAYTVGYGPTYCRITEEEAQALVTMGGQRKVGSIWRPYDEVRFSREADALDALATI